MAKERVALWDNLKFFLIVSVVTGHLLNKFTGVSDVGRTIFFFIYSFHMPLFVFVSGLFHKNKDILKKCLFYVSAGFGLKILIFLTNIVCGKKAVFSLLSDNGIPWFMFVLAVFTLISYLIRNQNKTYILIFSIILACFVGYDRSVGDYLYISRTVVFFPFYHLATMINPQTVVEFKKKNYKWLVPAALAVIVVWAVTCYVQLDTIYSLRFIFTGRNPYSAGQAPFGFLWRLLCYAISAVVGFALVALVPTRSLPLITKMGQNTIDVYFWHWTVYLLLQQAFNIHALFSQGPVEKAAYVLLAVPITIILAQGRIFSFPLKQIKKAIYKEQ